MLRCACWPAPIRDVPQSQELVTHLTGGPLSNTATQVINSSFIVQVRPLGVTKGFAAKTVLMEHEVCLPVQPAC